ncbi:hypothetical protein PV762_12485 [Mitsuaria sp. CC2]|uniref:hypothetical protein n=1 Tax=Mitsuaria sp. CC2 TaxID=3029186 RepID=UPI003B8D538D
MDNIFRVAYLSIAILNFALAWYFFSNRRPAMGLAALSACAGLISASNLSNPSRKIAFGQFLKGRERFETSAIGVALSFLSLVLIISALCVGWFEI